MAKLTLSLEIVFVLLAFGLRSWVHYRRTGSAGYRGLSGRVGSVEWFGGVLFAAAIVLGLAAPLLSLRGDTSVDWVRAAPLVLGIVGTVHAQLAMGDSWRVGVRVSERTTLVRRGPFKLVRNPIFTWMVVALVGVFVMLPSVVSAAAVVAVVVAIELQVRFVEEPYLLRTHGDDYRSYGARTGRFVPFVGRLS